MVGPVGGCFPWSSVLVVGGCPGWCPPPVSSLGGPVLAFSLSPRWAVRDSNPRPLARHASVYVLVGTLQSSDQCLSDLLRLLRWLKSPASVGTSVGTLFPSISCWTSPAKLHGRTHRGNRTPRSPTPGQSQGMSPNPRAVKPRSTAQLHELSRRASAESASLAAKMVVENTPFPTAPRRHFL